MRAKNSIYPVQMLTITVSAMLGVHILTVQYDLTMRANQDGWISILLSGVLVLLLGIFVNYPLAAMYPENDLPEVILVTFGKIFGRIFLIATIVYALIETGLSIRVFAQALKVFLLYKTPTSVIVILTIIAVISVSMREVNAIGSAIDFMFPVYVIPLGILILFSLSQADFGKVQPILYRNMTGVLEGSIHGYDAIIGYGILNYFLRYTIGRKNAKKWFVAGISISVFLYILLTLLTCAVFGPGDIKTMVYPTLTLSRAIEFPVALLQRLESFIVIVWIPGVFAWMTLFSFASKRNITVFFGIKPKYEKYVAYAHIPLLSIIALAPANELVTMDYLDKILVPAIFIGIFFVPFLTLIAYIKKRKESKN